MWTVTAESLQATVAEIVGSTSSRAERAARACLAIRDVSAERWVGIYSVVAGQVVNEAWVGPAPPAHPRFSALEGLTSDAITTGRSVVSNDVANDHRYLPNQVDSGSELIVPVFVASQVVGTLDIESERAGAFDPKLTARFETVALALPALWA